MRTEIKEGILRIRNKLELEKYMFYYNCKTKEELDERLFTEYGITLIID